MKICVIGSGLSALACVKSLLERKLTDITVIDFGKKISSKIEKNKKILSEISPHNWPENIVEEIKHQHKKNEQIPRKSLFGSSELYDLDEKFFSIKKTDVNLPGPTNTFGGYSNGWGGAILPYNKSELDEWPIKFDNFKNFYKKVFDFVPIFTNSGNISQEFPLYSKKYYKLKISKQAQSLLDDLNLNKNYLQKRKILFSSSRLSLYKKNPLNKYECNLCGFCLNGCPRDSVFNARFEFQKLIRQKKIKYQSGLSVEKIIENKKKIKVYSINVLNNEKIIREFDYVFLGAGVFSTTKILLNSKKIFNKNVTIIESKKFGFALLRPLDRLKYEKFQLNFCNLFIEANFEGNWIHSQVSPMNDFVKTFILENKLNKIPFKNFIEKKLINKLLICWSALHSKNSDKLILNLKKGSFGATLHIDKFINYNSKIIAKKFVMHLMKSLLKTKTIVIPKLQFAEPGRANHCGGSFPMRNKPKNFFESDIYGRALGYKKLSIIDSSIFPSIPSSTIALTIMANALRIGQNVRFNDN